MTGSWKYYDVFAVSYLEGNDDWLKIGISGKDNAEILIDNIVIKVSDWENAS